jgi:dienelactone hydrolase
MPPAPLPLDDAGGGCYTNGTSRMKLLFTPLLLLTAAVMLSPAAPAPAPALPHADQRAAAVHDYNTPRTFPQINSSAGWKARIQDIRDSARVSCGLWPMPPRAALNPRISPPSRHDGVAVHRVFFETYPNFYLAGTLYIPDGKDLGGKVKLPAILNPHGHGKFGRLHDDDAYSNPARCIQFARLGMVAFSYDMVGYQDTIQLGVHRKFLLQPELQLWNLSLMGLQTWNSIRAVDFLAGLPFVDPKRIACTGESGGGTQTFMLAATDNRLAVTAPICMVSHSMQGGCQCENAPGLRVDYSSMELAAAAAPTRQLLVAATGDWTKATMTVEGPALASVYKALGAREKLHYELLPAPHNYNQATREVVYGWFNHWLLGAKRPDRVMELPHTALPEEMVRVFPEAKLPPGALNEQQFVVARLQEAAMQIAQASINTRAELAALQQRQKTAWRHNLHVEEKPAPVVERAAALDFDGLRTTELAFGRPGRGDRIEALLIQPAKPKSAVVIVAHPLGRKGLLDDAGRPTGVAGHLVARGYTVLLPDLFQTGPKANLAWAAKRQPLDKFFTTYNRTDAQERVQDLLTAAAVARKELGAKQVVFAGEGRAGLWALLAAPGADGVAADCAGENANNDTALLAADVFTPGLKRMGAFAGVAVIAAPNPLLIHNARALYARPLLDAAYATSEAKAKFRIEDTVMDGANVAAWIAQAFPR